MHSLSTQNSLLVFGFLFMTLISCSKLVMCNGNQESSSEEANLAQSLKSKQEALRILKNVYRTFLQQRNNEDQFNGEYSNENAAEDSMTEEYLLNKRSPIVFPRIGAEKKRAIFKPRIGRAYDMSQLFEESSNDVEKRAIIKPRIGRSFEEEGLVEKRAIYKPRVGK